MNAFPSLRVEGGEWEKGRAGERESGRVEEQEGER
jgi:hypothetical protein